MWTIHAANGYRADPAVFSYSAKASFRSLIARHRVVILADGYYEWKKDGKEKQPYRFRGSAFEFQITMIHVWNIFQAC